MSKSELLEWYKPEILSVPAPFTKPKILLPDYSRNQKFYSATVHITEIFGTIMIPFIIFFIIKIEHILTYNFFYFIFIKWIVPEII